VAFFFVTSPASAHRPQTAEAWWGAFDEPKTQAPAQGVHVLRTVPRGRVRVAGGTFVMGSTAAQMARAIELCEHEILAAQCHEARTTEMVRAEGKAHPVTLTTFDLDRTEVTVADYARCVSAGACAPADLSPDDTRFSRPDLPVTHVRWTDAATYCSWAGGRLPTEAEWEYAARGTEGREFPWGNVYNPHLANHGASATDRSDSTDGYIGLAPVGSFPDGATPLGILDMAGNVAEWVADLFEYDAHGRPVGYDDAAATDPKPKTIGGGFHVARGGSFQDGAMKLRAAARDEESVQRPSWVGFRCAADVR
jgi:formylglycine-generating enzyme required for sulfatase activity